MSTPAISVVVIGRNEGQRLARCLESIRLIRGFDGESIEIIYVDSASKDGSPELASTYGAEVIIVHAERPTAALGRNAGWRAAKSEFVLFLDGDTVLHPDFVKAALEPMLQDASIVAVWGHRREIHPEVSIYNRILDLDWVYAPGIAEFCGGDVLMRRRALEEVGGYDNELIAGEEPEMCRRMRARGYRILHIDHPMTGHDLQMTRLSQYWKRATRCRPCLCRDIPPFSRQRRSCLGDRPQAQSAAWNLLGGIAGNRSRSQASQIHPSSPCPLGGAAYSAVSSFSVEVTLEIARRYYPPPLWRPFPSTADPHLHWTVAICPGPKAREPARTDRIQGIRRHLDKVTAG